MDVNEELKFWGKFKKKFFFFYFFYFFFFFWGGGSGGLGLGVRVDVNEELKFL